MTTRLKDTLMLVGGPNSDRAVMREIFGEEYDLLEAENCAQAQMLLEQNFDCIIAVLADVPFTAGREIRALAATCRSGDDSSQVPLLLFVDRDETGDREELAYDLGATEVVTRPYTGAVLRRRLGIMLDVFLHKWKLEKTVAEQNEAIRNSNQVMLDALSAIIEHRNTESGNHVLRIRRFTKILLENVAENCPEYRLDARIIDSIASASALHDIGKISVPDAILNKPGKLTEEEFAVMKTHTTVGGELVQTLEGSGDEEYLRYAYNIALYHHERWDGSGYPAGLAGDRIPICAQVVGIADAFDALTTVRPYKPALPHDKAINMILNGECGLFSPRLLECFKQVRTQFVELALRYADGYSPKSDRIAVPLPGPVWQRTDLSSAQLIQLKYQTLLHHVNDTVIEFDLDSRIYHVVFNPNPEFEELMSQAPFEEMLTQLQGESIHPEDRAAGQAVYVDFVRDFFRQDQRKMSFRTRIRSRTLGTYVPYEVTVLRVNTQNRQQRIVMMIFHRLERLEASLPAQPSGSLHGAPALWGMVSSALRCRCDSRMTIDAGFSDLLPLTGYSKQEIARRFDGSLTALILPEDRPQFEKNMAGLLEHGGRCETEFRVLRKEGDPLWVLAKSRFYTEPDGSEYVYHAIRDNSTARKTYRSLREALNRSQAIIDQSGGIVFEWDLNSDTMYCSPKWKEHFGYQPVSKNYGTQMGIATHFHADDLPLIRQAIQQIKDKKDTICIDVRIADANAKYHWTRITATAYLDEHSRPVRITGMLQDVDALKRAELALLQRAEQDPLTKLSNKEATTHRVEAALASRSDDSLCAMLMLDLDNFKGLNDTYGHLYGDAVLTQVGSTLKKLFRANDIIGRIGGDEFLIYMQDIPNVELARTRCDQVLETLRTLLQQNARGLEVSCSIGVALVPEHGDSFTDLFRRADEALYTAKNLGRNRVVFYSSGLQPALAMGAGRIATRIDSDEQPGLANDSFVRYVFRRLYESRDVETTINQLLAYVGEQFNVSRAYIFENNQDNTCCSNTFEWCNTGITAEKDSLQNVSYITDIAGWPNVYNERGVFYCTDISTLAPQFRAILEPQGIKSMLQCAIMDNGLFRGYVGFDECAVHRLWTDEQINILQFLAEILALFLLKQRSHDQALAMSNSLRDILDRQSDWVYVIDPDTCQLKFRNAKTREIAPDSREGMVCYKAFMGRDTRCENCPAAPGWQEGDSVIIENRRLQVRVRSTASAIRWNGEDACLITCRDVGDQGSRKNASKPK